jgi:hypothetical protein
MKKYEKPEDIQRIARDYLRSKLEHDVEVRIRFSETERVVYFRKILKPPRRR